MNHGLDEESLAASGIKNRISKILQIKTEDEINQQIDRIKHQFGDVTKVERPSKSGDYLLLNISATEDSTNIDDFFVFSLN